MPAKGAEFVEAGNVVEMGVREQDGIEGGDLLAEGLQAEVGPEIDEKRKLGGLKVDGTAGAVVVGMGRGAHRAGAADDRNPNRGAGAEKGDGGGHACVLGG